MQYIIFGAGVTGRRALSFLDYWRVACFAANSPCEPIDNKEVVSYAKMLEMAADGDYIIAVASEKYHEEMVAQLEADGVKKYFVFHESDAYSIHSVYPYYRLYQQTIIVPYVKALSIFGISKYKRIAIYGDNPFLPYLIAEIAVQNDFRNIIGIIPTSGANNVRTLGLPCVDLDDVWDKIDCLVINERRNKVKNLNAMEQRKKKFALADIYNIDPYVPEFQHPELAKYKDIHKGQRCFLIGNGPSMRIEDLNTLHEHGEICFGFNKIYRIYDRTKWRADYLCMASLLMMEQCQTELAAILGEKLFADAYHQAVGPQFSFGQYIHLIFEEYAPNLPRFSDDPSQGVYVGYTIVYEIGLQMASYMGFNEIYLIGVDGTYSGSVTEKSNHFIDGYFTEKEKIAWERRTPLDRFASEQRWMHIGFEAAERYSRRHGFRIYNATRGGKVEAFERVDFDRLFD